MVYEFDGFFFMTTTRRRHFVYGFLLFNDDDDGRIKFVDWGLGKCLVRHHDFI